MDCNLLFIQLKTVTDCPWKNVRLFQVHERRGDFFFLRRGPIAQCFICEQNLIKKTRFQSPYFATVQEVKHLF